jgi:hypothetical protein
VIRQSVIASQSRYKDTLSFEANDSFTVGSIAGNYNSSVTEEAARTVLLSNLGRGEESEYVVGSTGSEATADWIHDSPFRVPDDEG